ncbi:MAG: DUF2225 domain-containing protein [Roseburia inulinivorans]
MLRLRLLSAFARTAPKLALFNTIVKKGKTSENTYSCLKLSWLYRGSRS